MASNARVRNLSTTVRFLLKLVKLLSQMVASSTFFKLTPLERAAIIALQNAIDAVLSLLPAPGDDQDPTTLT